MTRQGGAREGKEPASTGSGPPAISGLRNFLLLLALLLPGCVRIQPGSSMADCSTVVAHVMDGKPVEAFAGREMGAGTFRATYVTGAMKRYDGQSGWDVQHWNPSGFTPDRGIFVVDAEGTSFLKLPGTPTNSPTQAAAEEANAGATATFRWPGGAMFVQHVDSPWADNTPGSPNPTWDICRET